jgi:hypothetical protein
MAALVDQDAPADPERPRRQSTIFEKVKDNGDMRELFLWKYRDVTRQQVNEELASFTSHNLIKTGELDEHEAMMLLEDRGCAKTAVELRALLADIDKDKSHTVNFLEWLCFWFKKSYDDLNDFVDEEARERAYNEARQAGEAAAKAEVSLLPLYETCQDVFLAASAMTASHPTAPIHPPSTGCH